MFQVHLSYTFPLFEDKEANLYGVRLASAADSLGVLWTSSAVCNGLSLSLLFNKPREAEEIL